MFLDQTISRNQDTTDPPNDGFAGQIRSEASEPPGRTGSLASPCALTVFDPNLIILALDRLKAPFRFLDPIATLHITEPEIDSPFPPGANRE